MFLLLALQSNFLKSMIHPKWLSTQWYQFPKKLHPKRDQNDSNSPTQRSKRTAMRSQEGNRCRKMTADCSLQFNVFYTLVNKYYYKIYTIII